QRAGAAVVAPSPGPEKSPRPWSGGRRRSNLPLRNVREPRRPRMIGMGSGGVWCPSCPRATGGADPMTLTDRSEPRQRQRAGDRSRDGRGRRREAPAILHYGFRPFFLLAGVHGVVAVPLWLWSEASGMRGPFVAADWHVHEMIFGYIGAVIAGFVLTAVPNWTGRMPLSGTPLALLALSWLAGRLAIATVPSPVPALAIDLVFPLTLTGAVLREIIAGRNWRNAPLAALLTLFTTALALHHLEAAGMSTPGLSVRIALGTIALMIALIGGRVTPSFTRNWLVRRGETHLPASFGLPDRLALVAALAAMLAWIAVPDWSGIL